MASPFLKGVEVVGNKRFKDPIYGYVDIDEGIVSDIIDTPAFQRLKDIRQTSYTPLYPAAYHNRYIHSLGVFYLGKIAFKAIEPQLKQYVTEQNLNLDIDRICGIFELACLLHDVGHAPFSHTGETFYLDEEKTLYSQLKECVGNEDFTKDFDALGTKMPAAHECMSCVVGLKTFDKHIKEEKDRALFARCIIGLPVTFREAKPQFDMGKSSEEKKRTKQKIEEYNTRKTQCELYNCVISLLNSSIIDVDRLDYIIRDAATIGFKSVQVDYSRLLNGMRIVQYKGTLCIGYHKSALSVIESAIYAHDAEKKWVQSHPAILYEMEALKNAMSTLTAKFASKDDPNPIFCYKALTEQGKILSLKTPLFSDEAKELAEKGKLWTSSAQELIKTEKLFTADFALDIDEKTVVQKFPIALLADEDFLYLMKRFCRDGFGFEYFARNRRRLAVWKSEAEFRALFQQQIGDDSRTIQKLERDFESIADYCQTMTSSPIISSSLFGIMDGEEKEAKIAKENGEMPDDYYEDLINGNKMRRHWANVLKELAEKLNLEFEFLIIFQKKFSSSFKADIGDIPIFFPNVKDGVVALDSVITVLKGNSNRKSNFFHLYYKPKSAVTSESKKEIMNTIAQRLISEANIS